MSRRVTRPLLLLLLLVAAPQAGAQEGRPHTPERGTPERQAMAGGHREAAVNDPGVVAAAEFAVREQSRRARSPVTLVSIKRAETQVVAGLNFRLVLSVRSVGRVRDVSAEVFRNLRQRFSLTRWSPAREVRVYLVALGDNGRRGKKIGCEDSLVPVVRTVAHDAAPLRAAVEELLRLPREYEGGLTNSWWGENLRVRAASISGGVATIRLSGNVYVAGVCDGPRIRGQIEETARQFPNVRRVRVFINGRTLAEAVR